MGWSRALVVLCILCGVSSAQPNDASPTVAQERADRFGGWSSERILVRMHEETVTCAKAPRGVTNRAAHLHSQLHTSAAFDSICTSRGVFDISPAYPFPFAHPKLAAELGLDRTFVLSVPPGTDTVAFAQELRGCHLDVEVAAVDALGGVAALIPNDRDFTMQYGLHNTGQAVGFGGGIIGTVDADIDAPEAWALATATPAPVTIAIIDSGVFPHREFGNRIVEGINTNSASMPDLTTDENGHGTHVTGIATATGNNGIGVAGVMWTAKIMPIRVVTSGGLGSSTQAAQGLIWAVDHGADICNMSLMYRTPAPDDLAFFESAALYAEANGVLVIAATGNNDFCGRGQVCFPARFPSTVAVTGVDNQSKFLFTSNFGAEVDVSAPGRDIWSTSLNNGYQFLTGTSMAAPFVSGLAALIKSQAPQLTHQEIRQLIIDTTVDLGVAGWDQQFGHGVINAEAALSLLPPPLEIVSSWPPNNAIDARQPTDLNGNNPAGWDSIEITFDGDPAGLRTTDFLVTIDPAGIAPVIASIETNGNTATLQLDSPIPVEAWTTFTYISSGMSVRIGYLPGDVNGDRRVRVDDIQALLDHLRGVIGPLPIWSTDVNRSNLDTPLDIARTVDLLNGAMAFDLYEFATLPD